MMTLEPTCGTSAQPIGFLKRSLCRLELLWELVLIHKNSSDQGLGYNLGSNDVVRSNFCLPFADPAEFTVTLRTVFADGGRC